LYAFFGMYIWTKLLCVFALLIAAGDLLITVFTIFYQRFLYDHVFRKRYDISYMPRCSIILPCKGVIKDLHDNIHAYLDLDYPEYEIIFTLESENDPAFALIKELAGQHPKASVVIAGLATKCSQKNFNLLYAIKKTGNPEVYIFADADIRPNRRWLREIVLPLSSPKVTVTTGFRWLTPATGSIGDYVHIYINIFLYTCLTFINSSVGTFLWGGSMAIRRKDFEDLNVADFWSNAVVDDNSLSRIIMKNSKKSVVVPACITTSNDTIGSVCQGITWFTRQIMFLKSYEKSVWFLGAVPLAFIALFLYLWFPITLILSSGSLSDFLRIGGGASVIFLFGELFTVALYPFLGSIPKFYKFLLLQPYLRVTHILSTLRTLFTNKIIWSGIKYHLTFSGKVSLVERLLPKEKTSC
jgi:ceramide glucosyltransferase